MGPNSVGSFASTGDFELFRGSTYFSSRHSRKVFTVNAVIRFSGRIVVSYDYRERNSSLFVIDGDATIMNRYKEGSTIHLKHNHGASMVTGRFYPHVVRNLNYTSVEQWLKNYQWSKVDRKDLLEGTSPSDVWRIAEKSTHQEKVKRELAAFFPTVEQEKQRPKYYESRYTSSEMRGKGHSKVERLILAGDELEVLSPEDAAMIPLSKIGIRPNIHLISEDDAAYSRRPAGVQQVKTFKKQTPAPTRLRKGMVVRRVMEDPAVSAALARLSQAGTSKDASAHQRAQERYLDDLVENF